MTSKPLRQVIVLFSAIAALPAIAQVPGGELPPTKAVSTVRRIAPVYPLDALLKGKKGWAEVRFMVDYSGRPVMTTIAGSSDPVFGYALMADVEANEFMPPRVNGQPQIALSGVRHTFDGETNLDASEKRVLAELKKPKPAILSAKELDAPLKSTRQEPPVYPYAQQSDGISGRAEIEFVVDRDGRALLPRVVNASSEDFGWAACAAVVRWRYQPPVKGGQKVDARTTVVVNFDHTKGLASW